MRNSEDLELSEEPEDGTFLTAAQLEEFNKVAERIISVDLERFKRESMYRAPVESKLRVKKMFNKIRSAKRRSVSKRPLIAKSIERYKSIW